MLLSSHRMFVFFFFFYVFFPLPLFLVSDRPLQYYYAYAELAIIPGTFILYLYFFTVENIQQKKTTTSTRTSTRSVAGSTG